VIFTAILSTLPAAADPSSAVLAAPGDCAQPIGEFVTQSVYGQSAGVAGPASDHFAPRIVTDSLTTLLPIDLTRTATPAVSLAGDAIDTTSDGVSTLVEGTSQAAPELIDGVIGNEPVVDLPETNDLVGSDFSRGDGLPSGSGSPDAGTLTSDLTKTVNGLVGSQ
jgi:hypothetical protein